MGELDNMDLPERNLNFSVKKQIKILDKMTKIGNIRDEECIFLLVVCV